MKRLTKWSPRTRGDLMRALRRGGNAMCMQEDAEFMEVRFKMDLYDLTVLLNAVSLLAAEKGGRKETLFNHTRRNFFAAAYDYRVLGTCIAFNMERCHAGAKGFVRVIMHRSGVFEREMIAKLKEDMYLRWIA